MKNSFAKGIGLLALNITISIAAVTTAHAGAFDINPPDAKSLGLSFAGAAAGGSGLASLEYNPATITDFNGMWGSQSVSFIHPSIHIESPADGQTTDDLANGGRWLPSGQATYQVNDKIWFGLSTGAPYGLVTKVYPGYSAAFYDTYTGVFTVAGMPMMGVKLTDWLSVAAGAEIFYFEAHLGNLVTPLVPGSYLRFYGHDITATAKYGFTIKPSAGAEFGMSYRFAAHPHLGGSLTNNIALSGLSGVVLPGSYSANANLTLPGQLNVGYRQVVTDDLTLDFTYQWTNWGIFNRFAIDVNGLPALPLNFSYRDGWLISGGGEYKLSPQVTLRSGFGYEKSPITTAIRNVNLPDADRFYLGFGGSYQITPQLSVDFAYQHVFFPKTPINLTSTANPQFHGVPFAGTSYSNADAVAVTANYRFDAPPPVVTAKY